MIGRFAAIGTYRELFAFKDFAVCLAGGALAGLAWLWEASGAAPAWPAVALALASLLLNGAPIVKGAAEGLLEKRLNVDELVSLALLALFFQGQFLAGAEVAFVMTLGALVEEAVSDSARRSIRDLVAVSPDRALRLSPAGTWEETPAAELRPGDRLLVKPGERAPVDGLIRAGSTALDESSLTGESLPRDKTVGDAVFAGTLNHSGVIEVEATAVGEDAALGRVIRLVEEAENHRPQATRFIDRHLAWFTPTVLLLALAAWAWSGELGRAVAVLVAGCPCALIMAAPTATVAAVGRLSRAGVLVKGGQHLEAAARIDTILFDKTGSLTRGQPRVVETVTAEGVAREDLLAWAAGVEEHCAHPLARAVLLAAHYAKVTVARAAEVWQDVGAGVRGLIDECLIEVGAPAYAGVAPLPEPLRAGLEAIQARGATPLVVRRDKAVVGVLGVADSLRPQAAAAVADLKGLGLRLGLVSGDHERAVRSLAGTVGIGDVWAERSPQGKLEIVAELQKKGAKVMFVGDGVNDAPALARADVGVAMAGAGTAVALETADLALVRDDLSRLPFLIRLARRTLRVIRLNVVLALGFNGLAILGSWAGLLSPVAASVAHNVGSIVVVVSAASLAFVEERGRA